MTTSAMVKGIMERHYHDVTRYTSSTFLRMKLGEALEKRELAPHLSRPPSEAEANLPSLESIGCGIRWLARDRRAARTPRKALVKCMRQLSLARCRASPRTVTMSAMVSAVMSALRT
jgi:hypothetical protein